MGHAARRMPQSAAQDNGLIMCTQMVSHNDTTTDEWSVKGARVGGGRVRRQLVGLTENCCQGCCKCLAKRKGYGCVTKSGKLDKNERGARSREREREKERE